MNGKLIKMKSKKLTTPISNKLFIIICGTWLVSVILLGITLDYLSISIMNCDICNIISKFIPSIERIPSASNYSQILRIVWLYLVFSSPIVFFLMWKFTEINREAVTVMGIFLLVFVGILAFFICIHGTVLWWIDFQAVGSGRFSRLYRETLLGGLFISAIFWIAFIEASLLITKILFSYFSKNK